MALCLEGLFLCAQSYQTPESVVFDAERGRYLVSNIKSKNIIAESQHNSDELSIFAEGLYMPLGLEIVGERLFVADSACVRGFDLESGAEVFRRNFPGCTQLNGINSDSKRRLFVSDREQNFIFRIDVKKNRIDTLSTGIKTPNGLYYDRSEKRLYTCTSTDPGLLVSCKVKGKKPASDFVERETPYPFLDGLVRLNDGSLAFSSWGKDWSENKIIKVNGISGKDFGVLWEGEGGPADIEYVPLWNMILMPMLRGNRVELLILDEVLLLE